MKVFIAQRLDSIMKTRSTLACAFLIASSSVIADPGFLVGVSYNFGGQVGITMKVLSTSREDRPALAAGISYFPTTKKLGVDASAGYVFSHSAITAGWDFLNSNPQIGLGYVNTHGRRSGAAPPAATSPAVTPPVVTPPVVTTPTIGELETL
jgi:hypothetical protein